MKLGSLNLKAKIMLGQLVPIGLAVILSAWAVVSVRALLDSVHSVDHAHRVVRQAMGMEEGALNMQTGMRGFLLTGQDDFLQPYVNGSKEIGEHALGLRKVTENSPEQTNLVAEMEAVVESWKNDTATPAIDLRTEIGQGKGMDDLAMLIAEGKGKKYFDAFRSQIKKFIEREQAVLEDRKVEVVSASYLQQVRRAVEMADHSQLSIHQALSAQNAATDMEAGAQSFLLAGKEDFLGPYNAGGKRLFALLTRLKAMVSQDPAQAKLVGEMEQGLKEWVRNVIEPQIALRRQISASKTMVDLRNMLSKGEDKKQFDKFRGLMASFKGKEEAVMIERQKSADATASNTQNLMLIGTGVVVVLAILSSYLLAGAISRPVNAAVGLAESISTGDLSRSVQSSGSDEVGRLGSALNDMAANLREQTRRTLEGVTVLSASASEISATAAQLAASTSKTSSAVTETTTTVEQVKQSARVAGERARSVAETSKSAVTIAETGKRATMDTIHRMGVIREQMESIGETVVRLSEHTRTIEEIINAVQDISDQSNLLAVNASIEAARAGDQGKGFSVVAHEIKTLAQQSREATEQVRAILDDTRKWVSAVVMATEQGAKAVAAGVEQSEAAGDAIQALAGSITASSQAASVIDTSTEQQFAGVGQVAAAMSNIDTALQQNLSGTVQLQDAAHKLEELGQSLQLLVQRYRI